MDSTSRLFENPRFTEDYQLLDKVCEGGMGVVYRARQRRLNRIVALKMIRFSRRLITSDLHRFRIEAEACANLRHENIVEVYESYEHEGQAYFSMAYIEGGDLRTEMRKLQGKPMPTARAARLLGAVARAVHHAHQQGVLHRDLKPGNILLDQSGKPYVSDFGLAKFVRQPTTSFDATTIADAITAKEPKPLPELTRQGQCMGSPGYASPEQASGKINELTTASDVFSLGAILYRLVTGQAPFPTEDWDEFVLRARQGSFQRPSVLNPQVDADLEAICLHCLEPDPRKRASSAASLADQLDHWLKRKPLDPDWRSTPVWERCLKWVRRHRTATALIAALVAVLALIFSAGSLHRHAARQKTLARESQLLDLLTKADGDFANGNAHAGLKLLTAVIREAPRNPVASEWLINVLRQRAFLIPIGAPTRGPGTASLQQRLRSARSPDGTREATATEETIELVDRRSGQRHRLQEHLAVVRSIAFSQDGRFVVSASDDQTARIWDAATGRLCLSLTNFAAVRYAEFSPDGAGVVTACRDGKARLWKAQDGAICGDPFTHASPLASARFSSNGLWMVTVADDGGVQIWDTTTGRRVAEPLLVPRALDAQFGGDRTVIVETEDGQRHSFHVTPTAPLDAAPGSDAPKPALPLPEPSVLGVAATRFHAEDITSYQVSPDGRVLATASADRTARLWDAHTLQPLTRPLHHLDIVNCVRFSPDGRRLVTSSADRKVRVWDARTGLPLTDWLVFDEPVAAVAFSADGGRIITSSGWTWELHLTSVPAPMWLPRLADAIASAADPAAASQLLAIRRELAQLPEAESAWAKRLLEIP